MIIKAEDSSFGELISIKVYFLTWLVEFHKIDNFFLMGLIFEKDNPRNCLEFFSKEYGFIYLSSLRAALEELGVPFSEGEYDLLYDEIRFSPLPQKPPIPERLYKVLKGKEQTMDNVLRRYLLRFV